MKTILWVECEDSSDFLLFHNSREDFPLRKMRSRSCILERSLERHCEGQVDSRVRSWDWSQRLLLRSSCAILRHKMYWFKWQLSRENGHSKHYSSLDGWVDGDLTRGKGIQKSRTVCIANVRSGVEKVEWTVSFPFKIFPWEYLRSIGTEMCRRLDRTLLDSVNIALRG